MINTTSWQCPKELIERALAECPIEGSRVALNIPTGDFFYDNWKIKDEFKGTAWEEVLDTLPYTIGEARVITLAPGESYMCHADIDNRWHLNLTGDQSYLIDLEEHRMFKQVQDSHWRYMFASKLHTASNYGSIPRLQLVVREPLKHSKFANLISVSIAPAYEQNDFRYKFDNIISPWLNQKNQSGELDAFANNGISVSFKIPEHLKEELMETITTNFKVSYE
jgi:hypothetical protein